MKHISHAFVVASGKGQRLKSVSKRHKALISIAGKTLLEHTINRLIKIGINNIYIIIRYNQNDFSSFMTNFNSAGTAKIKPIYLREETYIDSPLSDLLRSFYNGSINVPENFLISYCDTVTDFDISELINIHFKKNSSATLLLFSDDTAYFQKKYSINDDGLIYSIRENEFINQEKYAQGGIYILKKDLMLNFDFNKKIDFSDKGGPIEIAFENNSLYGIKTDNCFFMEIGTPENFYSCERKLLKSSNLLNNIFCLS